MHIKPVRKRIGFTDEQKLQILRDIDKGVLTRQAASKKYGISLSGLGYWRATMAKAHHSEFQEQVVNQESQTAQREQQLEKEIDRLKIQLAEAFLEMEFLKKAHSSMVREKRLNTSVVTATNLARFQEDADS
jgi:transposase-like protein